jgi:hypothetical protein
MQWIFFLLALGCFALAMRTQSMGFALLLLLAALGLMLAGALGLVAARIQNRASSGGAISLNPALEKQRLAQQRAATQRDGGGETTIEGGPSSGSRKASSQDDHDGSDGGGGDGGGD